ncbi:hypothetical protein [Sphingomonas japonica]|uniref:Small lipoprotein YifL n=2 Tax=Sphingomonas japonica TaxID=511662 RepID=A0ABX0TZS2_9SPHN|nr:putative small lipoprotein YifL [Sphingomonas japonica]
MRSLVPIALLALLAGCGARGDLEPAEGRALPPAPYGAEEIPTPDDLLTPSTQARPTRSDELLQDSSERDSDPFDLPPD